MYSVEFQGTQQKHVTWTDIQPQTDRRPRYSRMMTEKICLDVSLAFQIYVEVFIFLQLLLPAHWLPLNRPGIPEYLHLLYNFTAPLLLLKVTGAAGTTSANSGCWYGSTMSLGPPALSDAGTMPQDAAACRRPPRPHRRRHGNQPPPGGGLHHATTAVDRLPAAPVGQREPGPEGAQTLAPGRRCSKKY